MKAYLIYYDTASTSGFSEIVLVEDEKDVETALEAKSTKDFEVGCSYSRITRKQEIPLSQVKLSDLSITEFLLL